MKHDSSPNLSLLHRWNVSLDIKLGPELGPIFVSVALIPEHDYEMSVALLCEHIVVIGTLIDRKVMGMSRNEGI